MTVERTSDMVSVVRCYECEHYFAERGMCQMLSDLGPDGEWAGIMYVPADWYCAYGERRDSE